MAFQIDFISDVANHCTSKLAASGYTVSPADDEDAIRTYVSVLHRRVASRPRAVHKANYTVPAHLANGERDFLAKVQAGDDLWPHQSRSITKVSSRNGSSVEDGMLNDYGIQHFHLGVGPDAKHPGLSAGTKELLFAIVQDSDFYVIGIYDHQAWTKQALLDVVHATWPSLTERVTLKGGPNMKVLGLRHNYTDDEARQLRAAGVNVLQQRPDGSVQMGLGGGIATNGTSMAVTRQTDSVIERIENLQEEVIETLEPYVENGRVPSDAKVRLIFDGETVLAVLEADGIKMDVSDRLRIPPL